MQLLIDTDTITPAELAALVALLSVNKTPLVVPEDEAGPVGGEHVSIAPRLALVPASTDADPAVVFAANKDAPISPPPPAPPATSAAAPAGATPTTVAASIAGEVDKTGLPWDARIHAETKAKNKNGTWRTRRNLPDGLLETVTAELRAPKVVQTVPVLVPEAPAAPATAGSVPPPPPPPAGMVPPPPPPPVTLPVPPPPPPPGAAGVLPGNGTEPLTFATLMRRVSGAMNSGKLLKPTLDGILAGEQLGGLQELNKAAPEKLAAVAAKLAPLGV